MTIPNLMSTAIIINKPKSMPVPIRSSSGGLVIVRVPGLPRPAPATLVMLGCGDGGVIPAVVQVTLVAVSPDALAAVPDEEEAARTQRHKDDYEAQDWEGDYHAQVYAAG
jgi:hypothetical protein